MQYWVQVSTDPQRQDSGVWNGPFKDEPTAMAWAVKETKTASDLLAELVMQLEDGRGRRLTEFYFGKEFPVGQSPRRELKPDPFIPAEKMPPIPKK